MKKEIIEFINHNLLNGTDEVDADTELLISGRIDSLGIMRLVAFLKTDFDIVIAAKDLTLDNFSCVHAMIEHIESADRA